VEAAASYWSAARFLPWMRERLASAPRARPWLITLRLIQRPKLSSMPGPPLSTSAADISVDLKAGQIVTVDWRIDPDHPALNP
jgi:hypothetical protein